jgi:hypothetical protein
LFYRRRIRDSNLPAKPTIFATGYAPGLHGTLLPAHARRASSSRSTIRATLWGVPRSLHVRLDDASAAALEVVRGDGLTDSEAVRTALREAASRRRVRSAIRNEVRRLAADESDREEMRIIREQLAELAPPLSD